MALSGAGCSTGPDNVQDDPATADGGPGTLTAASEMGVGIGTAPADTLTEVTLELDLIDPLPLGPDGQVPLQLMEDYLDDAMVLASDGELDNLQDHLFVLRDRLGEPLPAETDSFYASHRQSLSRRVWMLEGILAEQMAFAGDPLRADSLLTIGYGRLAGTDFPDSLVPATGILLGSMTADLLKVDNKAVRQWVEYYTGRGRRTFQLWLERKAEMQDLIWSILDEHELPRELIYLAMIESGLSPRAVSNVSAVGPWQFMSGTAKDYGLRMNWWIDERRDMEMSTRAASRYIRRLHERFGDWALVLAAYNTGGGRIARKIRQHGHDNFWELRLPTQTTSHIPKFIAAARIGENPELFGFTIPEVTPLAFDVLEVRDATDLNLIASCADTDGATVRSLNPGLLRGASPPDIKNYPVKVPAGTVAAARRALSKVPADKRLTWRRHRVQRGETLGQIAREYGTSVADIAKLNKMGNVHLIRPGDQLLIPMPAELASKARSRAAEKGHYVPPNGYVRVSYKVKSGDTLGGIARKLGVTLTHLRKVNNIHRTNLIRPGQRIYAYRPEG